MNQTMALPRARPRRPVAILLVFVLLGWLPAYIALPPLDRDESRFAEASRQMVETGNYVDIRFGPGPRYNKPIGIYWLQALSAVAAGPALRDRIWVYRIPSLLSGFLCTVFLYSLARSVASRETALFGGFLLGTSLLLTAESVIATTDAALLATIIAAQSVLLRTYVAARENRQQQTLRFVLAGWVALGIGVLLKGPVILATLFVTAVSLSLADRQFAWLRGTRPLRGTLLALALVAPWAIAIAFESHGAFYQQSLGQDFAAKVMEGKESHGAPPGYYLIETIIAFWPATLVLVPAAVSAIERRREPVVRFLLAWSTSVWILFELIPTKLPHYVLPAYPALALLCAIWITQNDKDGTRKSARICRVASAVLFILGAAACAAACLYLPVRFGGHLGTPLLLGAIVAGVLAGASLALFFRDRVREAVGAAFACAICFDATLGLAVVPQLHDLWLSPRAAQLVAANKTVRDPPPVVVGYVEPSLVFLLGRDTLIKPPAQAANAMARGGIALVERRAAPLFLKALGPDGAIAKPLGRVSGLDYSVGRKQDITLYRLVPAQH
jgi:4-amino-4-deoxy-L-arabinose transferase-like glycosyltransferase